MASPQSAICHLKIPVNRDEEKTFDIASNDLFRPTLRQIRNSVFEIKKFFMRDEDTIAIIPQCVEDKLQQLKTQLFHRLNDKDMCLYHGDILRGETASKVPRKSCTSKGLVFVVNSIATALNLSAATRPSLVVCDVFIALPDQPSVLVTVVDAVDESREMRIYNASIARGLVSSLGRFLDQGYKTLFGILCSGDVGSTEAFNQAVRRITEDSSMVVTLESLSMNPSKYEKLLIAFWASVAETKSVQNPPDDCMRFLTKEQCIVFVDNINKRFVHVKSNPETGAKTLMLEVTERVARHDKTVLVCNTKAEKDVYNKLYSQKRCSVQVVTVEEVSRCSLQDCRFIVGVTETLPPKYDGHLWSFTRDKEDLNEQKAREEKDKHYTASPAHERDTTNLKNTINLETEMLDEKETELGPQKVRVMKQNSQTLSLLDMISDLERNQDDRPRSICSMSIADLVSDRSSEEFVIVTEDLELINLANKLRSRGLLLVFSLTIHL